MICRDLDMGRAISVRRRHQQLKQGGFVLPSMLGGRGRRALDPYASYVTCDLPFLGSNGSTSITDTKGNSWTASGATISTATASPWDNNTLLLPNTGNPYITSAGGNSNFDLAGGDFGIICWVYYNPLPTSGQLRTIYGMRASGAGTPYSSQWYVGNSSGTYTLGFFYSNNGTSTTTVSANIPTPTVSTWYQYFLIRQGSNLRFYINGTQVGATQAISGSLFYSASTPIFVGRSDTVNANSWRGNLKQFRIYKGVAPYTANFTPANPPLPVV